MRTPAKAWAAAVVLVLGLSSTVNAYYNPRLGRWMSRDPVEERQRGPNLYAFVLNDAIGTWDLIGLWSEPNRDPMQGRATTLNDKEPFTIDDLATKLHLDKDQAFGELGWVRNMKGEAVKGVRPWCWYKVPNEAHITQGDSGVDSMDLSSFLMGRKTKLIAVYAAKGYRVVDHTPGTTEGQTKAAVQAILKGSPDMYVWAHYGHGAGKVLGNLVFWSGSSFVSAPPAEFVPHHSLAEVVLFSCAAGQKESEWLKLVAIGGTLWSTPKDIFPFGAPFWWSAYSPLHSKEK